MSEQTTPTISTGKDILMERIRPYLLDPRKDYPEPYYMLEYNGVPFSTLGGLQAISGQKKNGKSFVLTMLMAAILAEDGDRAQKYLPGLRVPDRTIELLGHYPKVLYVDTEMEMLNSAKVLRRVHWLCDWDMKEPNEKFNVLWLKSVKKEHDTDKEYALRYQLIKQAIEVLEPDVVFIDGLRDLLATINDESTITEILSDLGTLAEERRMCIWNALHQNPTKDAEDQKMRGWAGTELGNKVSDTLISIKNKTPNGVSFTVKQQDARGKDLDDWKFQITDDAGALGIPKITNTGSNLPSKSKEEVLSDDIGEIHEWILKAKDMYEWPMSRKDIKEKVFKTIGGVTNKDRQQADLMAAINMKYLDESTMKSNGYPMLQPADEYPF
jgi:archaellum biogenesis ATPase FlaH